MRPRLFAAMIAAPLSLALVTLTAPASAQEEDAVGGKSGPFMANLKIGPSFGLNRFWPTQFALEIDAGYAVLPNELYITFSPQFSFGGGGTVIGLPVGAQYDIRIVKLGPGELFAYPRFNLGYARATGGRGANAFLMAPEAGAKYVINNRFNAGFEPLSFAIYAGDFDTSVAWRLFFYGGVNF